MPRALWAAAVSLLALAACGAEPSQASASAQGQEHDWRTTTSSRQYDGEDNLRVEVAYGAGGLKLAAAPKETLYRVVSRYDANAFSPRTAYSDGVLRVDMTNHKGSHDHGHVEGNALTLEIGRRVPVELQLHFGAAEANLDLGGLRIRDAEITTGASDTKLQVSEPNPESCDRLHLQVGAAGFEASQLANLGCRDLDVEGGVGDLTLDFSGAWKQDLRGSVRVGMGSVTLAIPRGIGVRIERSSVLSSFDPEGLIKQGDVYYTPGFASARRHLTLNLEAALGSLDIRWLDASAATY